MQLWTERGFETGLEDTTVDEIVRAAGVTRGTFYFHFAHKEEVLLEVGWSTAEALNADARRWVAAGQPGLAVLDQLLKALAERTESVPRLGVQKTLAAFSAHGVYPRGERNAVSDAFGLALRAAQDGCEISARVDVDELAEVMESVTIDAVKRWAAGDGRDLLPVLRCRAYVVVNGVLPASS